MTDLNTYIRNNLTYNPSTGILAWKELTPGRLPTVGSKDSKGQRYITYQKTRYKVSHICVFLQTKQWPTSVQFRNKDKSDLRWGNLEV
jgi:hypothetical protein